METLEDLRQKTGLPASEIQRRAKVSTATWYRANHGQAVSRDSVVRLLRVLNEELGTNYSPDSIDVQLTD